MTRTTPASAPGSRLASVIAAVALLAAAAAAPAQEADRATGRIQGQVVNSEDGSSVSSATVQLQSTRIGTLTDLNGRYQLSQVPAGTYDLVVSSLGFSRKTVTGVTIEAGQATSLDVTLSPEAVEVNDLTVSVEQEKGSAAALLDEQKQSLTVSDAVGEEQISGLPVSNAAESAKQIAGVTVTRGKYVFVRGLGKRYSQTSLNGSPLPSPEPEKSVVPLDLFPAGFLQSVRVQKTYTPDEGADFSGGTVQIDTKEFPDQFTAKFSVGSSVNTRSQFNDGYLNYSGGSLDFLGIDDGGRNMPSTMREELGGLSGQSLPASASSRERLGESLLGDLSQFSPTAGSTPSNVDWSFALGDRTEIFGDDFGYFVAGSYANSYSIRNDEIERKWRTTAFDPDLVAEREVEPNVNYEFTRGSQDVEWGGIGNFTYQATPKHQISLKTLYNRHGSDEARTYVGPNREDLGGVLRDERLRFIAREMAWGQLSGEHQVPGDLRLEWRGGAARAKREEPGLREAIYKRGFTEEDEPYVLENTGESARYLFSDLTETDLSGGLDLTIPFELLTERDTEIKVGVSARDRGRDFAARRFRWRFNQGASITNLDSVLTPENVSGSLDEMSSLVLTELSEPGDTYAADDDRTAGYGMITVPLTGDFTATLGARVERYELTLRDLTQTTDSTTLLSSQERTDVFPAVNLKYSLTDDMNLRAAASRTTDRPEFRELAPFQFTEAASLRQVFGNPELETAEITNVDLRWEWFPGAGEVISLSGFYKELEKPIEQVFISAAGEAYSYQNAEDGRIYGAEIGVRKRLGLLHDVGGFTVGGNLALIDSRVNVRRGGIYNPTNLERALEGQSDYAASATLNYRTPDRGTEVGASFNVFGERITAAGGSGQPDVVEQPRPELDFTFSQSLGPRVDMELEATNLLDSEHLWEQSMNGITRVQRRYTTGRTFSMSFTYGG